MDDLVLKGRLTEEDLVNMQYYGGLIVLRPALRLVVTLMVAGLIWWCFYWAEGFEAWVPAGLFLLTWFYVVILLPFDLKRSARRYYRKHENQYLETQVTLNLDQISVENPSLLLSLEWPQIGLVLITPKGLMFCNEERAPLFWLPSRLFEGNLLRERVLKLVVSKRVPIRDLS